MTNLMAAYRPGFGGSPEIVDMETALEPELAAAWETRDGIADQLCVDTATWGLDAWEAALGLPVETQREADYRRSRVKSKLRGAGVTTVALLTETAASFSNGAVAVIEYPKEYRLEIKFIGTFGIPPNLEDLTAALREVMPAHLRWKYVFVLNTWATALGSTWGQLAGKTWQAVKESKP
ncbi:MAG: putative phage tail protein [Oscillospiraceae bacterium]